MTKAEKDADPTEQRWVLLRDVGVLQAKLLIDGLRDLILVPASLIAGIVSLVSGKDGVPGTQFYELLSWGKQSEVWINLFGAAENSPAAVQTEKRFGDQDIDALVGRLESIVVEEVKRGGVTKQAKDRLEKILDVVQRRGRDK